MKMKMPLIPKLALVGGLSLCTFWISGSSRPVAASDCPRPILCTDNWNPVICSGGQIYSNACYAYRACATGCVPYGDTI
jgi:hypothetical protein